MRYSEAIDYINGTQRFGSKPGLERIARLLGLMGDPQDALKFVHVAGTNGKGSTCAALACALKAAGYRTGLYISPFVLDFCERIQIDGQKISEADVAAEIGYIKPLVEKVAESFEHPTEFEIITAAAFDYFKKQSLDVVVLEVGLGGRFDATNIIKSPLAAVVTSISLDHVDVLGGTLRKITAEKCGIIKEGAVAVSSPDQAPEALDVIKKTCDCKGCQLVIPDLNLARVLNESINGLDMEYKGRRLHIPLAGTHQVNNFTTAYEALDALRGQFGYEIGDEDIVKGFAAVRFPARMEILGRNPLVILDGAHNLAGMRALADSVVKYLKPRTLAVIMGMLGDKDYLGSIALIAPLADSFTAVTPKSTRALDADKTAEIAAKFCGRVRSERDPVKAFREALSDAGNDGAVLICGSLYLASEMRKIILVNYQK
jgi:dihydrofolate synthase/folylpolyglutamate synthase